MLRAIPIRSIVLHTSHKHKFRVIDGMIHDGTHYNKMKCVHCPEFYYVERGWFHNHNWFTDEKRDNAS